MSNNVSTTPYSFTSVMATSFLNTSGAVPSSGPIAITTVKWVVSTAGQELTITDGYGRTLTHAVTSKQDAANGAVYLNVNLMVQDFQVTGLTSGTVYVSTDAVSTATGVSGGQITTHGTAITAGSQQAQTALSIPGVTPSSVVAWSIDGTPGANWETGIEVLPVCTAGTVTLYLVNPTAASITPAAQVINVRIIS
jgi:hypothetical protein